jgi:IS1 family transposase
MSTTPREPNPTAWMIGDRTPETAHLFMTDLAGRLANRVQMTTDGHKMYLNAVTDGFGGEIDFAQFVKIYGTPYDELGQRRGSMEVIGTTVKIISGDPDPDKINTSYIERQNLTMRMGMRRFIGQTNGHSKKVENHAAAIALHYMHYNFARPHKSLPNPYPRTPAMAAGLSDHVWTCEEIAGLLD